MCGTLRVRVLYWLVLSTFLFGSGRAYSESLIFSPKYEGFKKANFACEDKKWSTRDSLLCLQDYANDSLLADTKTKLYSNWNAQAALERDIQLMSRDWRMAEEAFEEISLSELFRYEIPGQYGQALSEQCLLDALTAAKSMKEKASFVKNFKHQINEINSFLVDYHKSSLGEVRSLLFSITNIQVCDLEKFSDRNVQHRGSTLKIGIDAEELEEEDYESLSAKSILQEWNSSNAILYLEKSYWQESVFARTWPTKSLIQLIRLNDHRENGAPEGIIFDMLAKYWMILNPVGEARKTARIAIKKLYHGIKSEQKSIDQISCDSDECAEKLHKKLWYRISQQMNQGGFTDEQLSLMDSLKEFNSSTTSELQAIYRDWQIQSLRPSNLLRAIESSLLNSPVAKQEGHNITIMDRILRCGVAVANNHSIQIDVSSLLAVSSFPSLDQFNAKEQSSVSKNSNYLKFERSGVKLESTVPVNYNENTDENFAAVCVNTSDVIDINVQFPKISKTNVLSLSLYLSLEAYLNDLSRGLN